LFLDLYLLFLLCLLLLLLEGEHSNSLRNIFVFGNEVLNKN